MTDTTVATGLRVQEWDDKFFTEYIQHNLFKADMGTDENSIIHVKENLTKKKGDSITFALVNRLTGAGVTGSNTLEGNEEDMGSRSHPGGRGQDPQRRARVRGGRAVLGHLACGMPRARRSRTGPWRKPATG